jgi:NitT/TauT family transport system substrate-binding protein
MRIATRIAPIVIAAALCALSAPASAQHVWRHGLIKAKADAGIFLMVTTRDFAKKQGLDLKISEFKDDQIALKALIAGEVDSFEGGPQGAFTANAKGGDVRILGCHWVVVPHGIYAKSDIKTVEELKGKQIAVSAPNSMPDMLARSALAKHGLTPADVKLAALGGDNDRYKALVSGVVEAAVVSNEYEPEAPKGIHLLVVGRDAVPKLLRVCLMSSAKVLASKGDDAAHFLAAEMNALHYALTHKAEAVALTREIIHAKPDDPRPAFVYDDAIEHHAVDAALPLPLDKFAWVQDQLVTAGKISTPLDIKAVIAPEVRDKALKMVGGTH